MSEFTASTIRDLRDKTGAGMMDCKKALTASDGDMEGAIEFLRKSGLAKAAKKSGRETKEGKITTLVTPQAAVMVEILCETDFVAKNETFVAFSEQLCKTVGAYTGAPEKLTEAVLADQQQSIADLITKVGENIQVRRILRWQPKGKCASYLHLGGKIGVLVDIANESDPDYLHDVAMHIAAFNPLYLTPEAIPANVIVKEREIAASQPELADKPENVKEKIIQGKIAKWYNETCLVKQSWLRNDKQRVEQVKPNAVIHRFSRWQVGEEIQ